MVISFLLWNNPLFSYGKGVCEDLYVPVALFAVREWGTATGFFKHVAEMLTAVKPDGKGDVSNVHGSVLQQELGFLNSQVVDVGNNGTAHLFAKQSL